MLIKSISPKGKAIPLTAEEAVDPAIRVALASKNDSEFILWTSKPSITSSLVSHLAADGEYQASAEGTCFVGMTRVKDDAFFAEKPYTFKIQYRSSTDDIGAPDIAVTSFEMNPADPGNIATPMPKESKKVGGKVSGLYSR